MRLAVVCAVLLAVLAATAEGRSFTPTVYCDSASDYLKQPYRDGVVVLGRIELPRPSTVLRAQRPQHSGDWWGAKYGIQIRGGGPVVVAVAGRFRRRVHLDYGGGAGPDGASAIRFLPCPRRLVHWTAWAGAYLVKTPGCVPLVIQAGKRTARANVSVGRRCPVR